ncbi:MAG: 1-acyl-sn-glycerol-3-phosphate acyltransferase [Alphaproteobacteria bacterium]|nr:1-acyl-sn-glycerol-3-phosphate acyltransferase [Alphaproteobacteria bacterium]
MMKRDIRYLSREDTSSGNGIANKSNYLKRLLGTALGFSLIGVGGSILCLTLFPLITVLSRDDRQRHNRVRFIIRCAFKFYLKTLEFLGVIKLKASVSEDAQKIKGALIICNHPTLLDVVIIIAHLKNIQCVVKNALWKNPFLGGVVRAAGYIRNDLDPEEFYKNCKNQLDQGENILIFPEGTRSTPGKPIKLHRSLGNLAIAASVNIQALTLRCTPVTLIKGEKWYHIPISCPVFHLNAGRFFDCASYRQDLPRSLHVRALVRDIQHYYNRYLGYE